MACENKNTQNDKFATFSETEMEAAMQLIQLSNSFADSQSSTTFLDEDRHSYSSNSVSVQWKPQQSKVDDVSESPSPNDAIEDVLAEIEEDESLRRKNKRFRNIEDLYKVTEPVVLLVPSFKEN